MLMLYLLLAYSQGCIVANKEVICSHFLLKDLSVAKYFLGLELSRSTQGLYLSQCKYCLQVIEDSGLLADKPCVSPMLQNLKLNA